MWFITVDKIYLNIFLALFLHQFYNIAIKWYCATMIPIQNLSHCSEIAIKLRINSYLKIGICHTKAY